MRFPATWGSRDVLDTTLVQPALVGEISADRAIDRGGVFRHPLRFQRLRLDMTTEGVPRFGGHGVEMVERLPLGMRTPGAVTYARCA
ncbi:hypothetical protein [Streptomyces sp. BF23-19]|uniref:hypothetical protein n=1 Tax=unclassified Streptomyces TaxID=2593676 RepID=UPI0034E5F626